MAKTTKKRANAKGAAKKVAPVKAKPKKKGLRAPVKGKQRTVTVHKTSAVGKSETSVEFAPQSAGLTTLDLRERLTVEEQYEADQARAVSKPKRFRFRDAITGLFVRLGFAKKNPASTVRERVK